MAKGYPDYFGQSAWPKLGTPTIETFAGPILPTLSLTIFDVTGQLIAVSGFVRFGGPSNVYLCRVRAELDGAVESAISPESCLLYGLTVPCKRMIALSHYDSILNNAVFHIQKDMGVRNTYKIIVENRDVVNNLVVSASLTYYRQT